MGVRQSALEGLGLTHSFWQNKTVLLTGHTGFKGSWLSLWLQKLGANVIGYALGPPTEPNLFDVAGIESGMISIFGDVRDLPHLMTTLGKHKPEIVIHLAAQSLVRPSYIDPLETYTTNVIGTVNILESVRLTDSVRAVVLVTSDKCYENREWPWPYRENEPLGGKDPYSSSKACAELVATAYKESFFSRNSRQGADVALATARAGNVIGGGDWAQERLVPDCIRAFVAGRSVQLRYPKAVRPWQHVLEPLWGYLILAQRLFEHEKEAFSAAWNFGPNLSDDATVVEIAQRVASLWGAGSVTLLGQEDIPHEAGLLRLDITKAILRLGWRPRWELDRALQETVAWYKAWQNGEDMRAYSLAQISAYESGRVKMSIRFDFVSTPIEGLKVIQRKPLEDERGLFERLFCGEDFRAVGLDKSIIQINRSLTLKQGTVRGMHFQHPPYAETKIVSCLKGKVFDVAVDIRSGSPTFRHWHGEVLSQENNKSLLIPEGFAHGFQTLTG